MRRPALLLLLLTLPVFGETFYVSSAGGSVSCGGDGTQTTQAATFFNTAANWQTTKTAGKIGSGDTVNLCGTFTGTANGPALLTVQASGSSGSPITIRWESNALITSPACGNNGCVFGNAQKFLTFDGNGTNPSITNTANGSALANQIDTAAVSAAGCDNCEFKNLIITNIYQHSDVTDSTHGFGNGIITDGSPVQIHQNTFDQMYQAINYSPNSKNLNNTDIYSNTISHVNWGVSMQVAGTSAVTNIKIYSNHLSDYSNWDTTTACGDGRIGDCFHHDGIFFAENGSGSISNIYIYNNLFDGVGSNCRTLGVGNSCMTANIFLDTGVQNAYIFNNVHLTSQANAYVEGGGGTDANYVIENNYFDAGGSCVQVQGIVGITIVNNAFNGCFTYLLTSSVTGTVSVDYNVYDSAGAGTGQAFKWNGNLGGAPYSSYRASNPTLDVHSITPASLGTVSGVPQAGSALIHDSATKFSNLTSSCAGSLAPLCSDKNGAARPNTAFGWDAGAYQFGSSGTPGASISPASFSFGNILVGQTSAPQSATLTSNGTASLTVSSVSASGDFTVSSTSPSPCGTLAINATCTINLTFSPTTVGTRTGTLTVTDNASTSPQTVSLSGTGTAQATLKGTLTLKGTAAVQ